MFATDDIGGIHYPLNKLGYGALDAFTIVTTSAGLPVQQQSGATFDVTGAAAENAAVSGNPVLIGGRYDATPRTLGDGDAGAIALDADGAVHIADGGNSITIDGSVSLTGNLPDTAAGDLAAINAAVSGTLTVGSHAVTNAGTFAVQVDGSALTALQLIDNTVYVDDADWTATTSSHNLIGGVYQSTPGTITDGDTGPFRVTANGALHVSDAGGSLTVDGTVAATQSGTWNITNVSGTVSLPTGAATAANQSTAITHLSTLAGAVSGTEVQVDLVSANVTNAGTFAVQVDGTALTRLTDIETNTDFGATTGNGTATGALRVTVASDTTGVLSVDDNGGALTVDNGGTFAVQPTASASGGASYFRSIDLDESEEEVKATAATFYGGIAINLSASVLYLKFYNATAASVTVGTTTPVLTIPIPTQGDTNGAGFIIPVPACGVEFSTALTVACTTGIADADTGAPAANVCVVNLFYE